MRFLSFVALASLAVVNARTHHRHHASQAAKTMTQATPYTEQQLEDAFTSYVKQYNKKYTHDDFFNRYNVFKTNMEKIRIINSQNLSYTVAVNEFADQSWEEFKSTRLGFKNMDYSTLRSLNVDSDLEVTAAPTEIDWRTKGVVTPIKDQGQCGSCWAFSTTGSVEGAVAIKTGKLVSLSEQQLVDCSTAQGNMGCNGGLMDSAFQYIITNKGITSEASYPYSATGPNACKASGKAVAATISSFKDVGATESALLTAVASTPISVAIEADQESFQFYSGGILSGACGKNLDHGVLAVGYGAENGTNYWIVKNSWGASWGEAGYIRLQRDIDQCGISDMASYPVA